MISPVQREALDLLQSIAVEVAFKRPFSTRDIQYINNLAVLHAREAFANCEESGCRRHLMRMFLMDGQNAWDVPSALQPLMQTLYDHAIEEEEFPGTFVPLPYIASP